MVKRLITFGPEFESKEEIILRDHLALQRTRLANERTLLSYLRTSLYLLLGGIAFLQLQGFDTIKWIGYLSLSLSFLILVIGFFRFFNLKKRLNKYYEYPNKITPGKT